MVVLSSLCGVLCNAWALWVHAPRIDTTMYLCSLGHCMTLRRFPAYWQSSLMDFHPKPPILMLNQHPVRICTVTCLPIFPAASQVLDLLPSSCPFSGLLYGCTIHATPPPMTPSLLLPTLCRAFDDWIGQQLPSGISLVCPLDPVRASHISAFFSQLNHCQLMSAPCPGDSPGFSPCLRLPMDWGQWTKASSGQSFTNAFYRTRSGVLLHAACNAGPVSKVLYHVRWASSCWKFNGSSTVMGKHTTSKVMTTTDEWKGA